MRGSAPSINLLRPECEPPLPLALSIPNDLAFDWAGNLFVSAGDGVSNPGTVYKFTPAGVRTTFASGLFYPFALAFDSRGNLFVADGGFAYDLIFGAAVYKFTPSGQRSTVASENDEVPVVPDGLAIDSADNLFVADWVSGNILKFTPSGVRTTFASRFVPAMAFQPRAMASSQTLRQLTLTMTGSRIIFSITRARTRRLYGISTTTFTSVARRAHAAGRLATGGCGGF